MSRIEAQLLRARLVVPIRAVTSLAVAAAVVAAAGAAQQGHAAPRPVVVASTTSTDNSGLFELILPRFTADTGIRIQAVAVGTGQAIGIAYICPRRMVITLRHGVTSGIPALL